MADPKLDVYMTAIVDRFEPGKAQVTDALARIGARLRKKQDPQAVQILALRRYLRLGGARIVAQWPWNQEQIKEHAKESKELELEAKLVQMNFADANPGYSLAISPIRSLDKQVRLWCNNGSVQKAATHLLPVVRAEIAASQYLESPIESAVKAFQTFLSKVRVHPEPTSAAPGTSDHGQNRAVDFIVMKDGKAIADTTSSTIVPNWRIPGWEKALIDAAASTRLEGPLPNPYEPWHWWLPH